MDVDVGFRLEPLVAPQPGCYALIAARCVVTTGPRLLGHAVLWGVLDAHDGTLVLDTTGVWRAELSLDVCSLRTPVPLLARWLRREVATFHGRRHELPMSGLVEPVDEEKIVMWLTGNIRSSVAGRGLKIDLVAELAR